MRFLPVLLCGALLLGACGPGENTSPDGEPVIDAVAQYDARVDGPPWIPPVDGLPPLDYVMWAHSRDTLFSIHPDTFELTTIGTFGLPVDEDITDLAVTPDQTLYGISDTRLYTLDPDTGAATYVADVPGLTNVGMTFLRTGELLATDDGGGVRRINPATGEVTELDGYGGGYTTAGDLVAVGDGTMFTICDGGPECTWESNCLVTVDPVTGAAIARIGAIGFSQVFGAAYANGHVYAFTNAGQLIEVDRTTGAGTLVRAYDGISFWGAGVTPLVPIVE